MKSNDETERFPFRQNFRNFRFGGKWNTFRVFVPLENSQEKWKIWKGGPVFPVAISERNVVFHYVSRSLYQFQVHGQAQRRTGVYDQMEQLFTYRKLHVCSHRNFRFFLTEWKAPTVSRQNLWSGNIAKSMTSEGNSALFPANVDRRSPLQRGLLNF